MRERLRLLLHYGPVLSWYLMQAGDAHRVFTDKVGETMRGKDDENQLRVWDFRWSWRIRKRD